MTTHLPTITIRPFALVVYKVQSLQEAVAAVVSAEFYAITLTDGALFVVTDQPNNNLEVAEPKCRLFEISDTADFALEVSVIIKLLGEHSVGIIPMSNYAGDFLLIKDEHCARAKKALKDHRYKIN